MRRACVRVAPLLVALFAATFVPTPAPASPPGGGERLPDRAHPYWKADPRLLEVAVAAGVDVTRPPWGIQLRRHALGDEWNGYRNRLPLSELLPDGTPWRSLPFPAPDAARDHASSEAEDVREVRFNRTEERGGRFVHYWFKTGEYRIEHVRWDKREGVADRIARWTAFGVIGGVGGALGGAALGALVGGAEGAAAAAAGAWGAAAAAGAAAAPPAGAGDGAGTRGPVPP